MLTFLELGLALLVLVDVPAVYRPVEAAGDEEGVARVVLDVLHPVAVAAEGADALLQVARVPQHHRRVVRTGGERSVVQKPSNKTRD